MKLQCKRAFSRASLPMRVEVLLTNRWIYSLFQAASGRLMIFYEEPLLFYVRNTLGGFDISSREATAIGSIKILEFWNLTNQ